MLAYLCTAKPQLRQSFHEFEVFHCDVFLVEGVDDCLSGTIAFELFFRLFGISASVYFFQFGRMVLLSKLRFE